MEIAKLGDERWNEEDQCMEYVTSDMELRIAAKGLMMSRDNGEWKSPRKCQELERELGHVVFELAYRTHTVQDYIQMQKEAVLLDNPQVA